MESAENAERLSGFQKLVKKAGEIARNAHLQAINLRGLEVALLSEPTKEGVAATVHSEHSVEQSLDQTGEAPVLRVQVQFKVAVKAEAVELLKLKALFNIDYVLNKGMPSVAAEAIPAFAATNSIVHVWPYYRELVQSMAWRMGIPPFPLPLFRVTDPNQKASTQEAPTDKA